jgi:ECF transporter S component (folate family)
VKPVRHQNHEQQNQKQQNHIRNIVQAGLMVALAIAVRNFSYMVYFEGAAGMRLGFAGVFTRTASILSGPLFGGIASGLVDIIGYILKPEGAYIPLLTVTAFIGGMVAGLVWRTLKGIDTRKLQRTFIIAVIFIGIIGLANHIAVLTLPDTQWVNILNMLGKYRGFCTVGLEALALCGLFIYAVNTIVNRFSSNSEMNRVYFNVLLAVGISGLMVTIANTFILRVYIPGLAKIPLMVFLLPRIIEELIMTVAQSYFISILVSVYYRYIEKQAYSV